MTASRLGKELIRERFGPVPYRERYRRPTPPPQLHSVGGLVRVVDPRWLTAARRRVLLDALAVPHAGEEAV